MSTQHNAENYPTIFCWACNYIIAQVSSVPSEQVFSSSAETDTWHLSHITTDLMEKLQMQKCIIKKSQLNFTSGWRCEDMELEMENQYQEARSRFSKQQVDNPFDGISSMQEPGLSGEEAGDSKNDENSEGDVSSDDS